MKWFNECRFRGIFVGFVAAVVLIGTNAKADFTFGTPTNLGPTINTPHYEDNPCISADGLELYFNSSRPNNNGGADLWVVTRPSKSDPWGTPTNLGPIVNSQEGEANPCISIDPDQHTSAARSPVRYKTSLRLHGTALHPAAPIKPA